MKMADVKYLERALEGVSVQDENYDSNAPPALGKPKVYASDTSMARMGEPSANTHS